MIKINGGIQVQSVLIEYDLYIPVNIKLGDWNDILEPTIYWRTGDFQKSLIEIGIGEYNKEIRSITLVMCDKVYESEKVYSSFTSVTNGCPIATLHSSNSMYIDEVGVLKVCFVQNSMYIWFAEAEVIQCIKNKEIEFLLDIENNLVGICIKEIVAEQMEILKKSLV